MFRELLMTREWVLVNSLKEGELMPKLVKRPASMAAWVGRLPSILYPKPQKPNVCP